MKALVLGMGLQGKAVVHDLEQSPLIEEIVVADLDQDRIRQYLNQKGYHKSRAVALDATRTEDMRQLAEKSGAHIMVSMLPPDFALPSARAALAARIPFVNSSYTGPVAELDAAARQAGVTILPEMGMDPGIDLVLARSVIDQLDEVHGLYSYGAGLPEPACAQDNPLHYKLTWTFEGVLKAYLRPARFLKNGTEQAIAGGNIFRPENIHEFSVPGAGAMEAYYNGDAVHYIDVFNLAGTVRDMGRFAMRWPGHCAFWQTLTDLGFLEDTKPEDSAGPSPRQFLVDHLTPRLQFENHERDMVIIRLKAWGLKDGRPLEIIRDLLDYRDLETGLFAMNRTVGFTASIGAQLILSGKINRAGVLNPARDVAPEDLLPELTARGMQIQTEIH